MSILTYATGNGYVKARQGKARQGTARHGKARQGKANLLFHDGDKGGVRNPV